MRGGVGDVVVVTWQGGGASLAALGLAERLAARGHAVRMVAPRAMAGRVAAAGAEHVALPEAVEFDPALGRSADDQPAYLGSVFDGDALPALVAAEVERHRPDVVVVDILLSSTMRAVAASGVALVALGHMAHAFFALDDNIALADRTIVALPQILDPWDAPASVVHTGAIEPSPGVSAPSGWISPWAADDPRPLVVVTMGTTFMHHQGLLGRVGAAARRVGARALILTGDEMEPDEVGVDAEAPDGGGPGAPGVAVAAFVPHRAVLPAAAAVVHHAGAGTAAAVLAAGLPSVCIPLGRDQQVNAARLGELGAAVVVEPTASDDQLVDAIALALGDPGLRRAAEAAGEQVRRDGGGAEQAADEVERVMART